MTTAELTFSLVVNTTDRAEALRTLLRSLEHQSYPHFEVIVVVGPTRDHTWQVLSDYEGRVRVLRCPTANLSRSRNIGLLAARGDIVAFIDDDAVPSHGWLEQLARLLRDPFVDATGGMVYTIYPQYATVQHRIGICSSLAEHVDVRGSWLEHLVPPGEGSQWAARMMGTNMAFRRPALLGIGGFDEFYVYIAEESDLALRLVNAGRIIQPAKEAPVYHAPASSRNRQMFTPKGRWWLQTRSSVYFAIKNGLAAGDPYRSILVRCRRLVLGHWDWYNQLRREGIVTLWEQLGMSVAELRGAASGFLNGLFRPRRLIPLRSIEASKITTAPIQPFQVENSSHQPAVDPVQGHQPSISMPDPPLRVCLLSMGYPPAQFDGVGRLTHLMARGLFERGHTVHVVTRGEREQVSFYDGAYVHQIAPRLEHYHQYQGLPNLYHSLNHGHAVYEQVRRLVLNDGIQLVDSPLWQVEGFVTLVSGIAPVVVRLVTSLRQIRALQKDRDHETALMEDMEHYLLEHAAHLMPNTQATWETISRLYRLRPVDRRHTIVPYGMAPASEADVRPFDLKCAPERFTILYVGRLEKRKGILDLFQAIPRIVAHVPNVKFIIAGSDNSRHDGFQHQTGMDYPAYFAQHYQKYASYVEFKGTVEDEALQTLYQSCDLFTAPSLYESFGLIYLEAMNFAKPVVGCRAGGVPEVVDHAVTGLLVDPQAPAALAEAVVSLLKSPQHLRDMGLAGRQRLMERFTYLGMARAFEQVYRMMLRSYEAHRVGETTMIEAGVK